MPRRDELDHGNAGAAPREASAFLLRGVRQRREGVEILRGVNLEIPSGRVTALIGPSGAGKTSLLRLLNRLDDPVAGEIRYRGASLSDHPVQELRYRVGFVFQTPVMFPGTLRVNLREAAVLAGRRDEEAAAVRAIRLAELDPGLMDRDGERLSVGQKQRANLARALMTQPEVLLMDEPTSALDPETADRLIDTVRHLSETEGLTIVTVTHRLREARRGSDFTAMLEDGRVIAAGRTEALFAPAANARVREFLQSGG